MNHQATVRRSFENARPIHHACLVVGCLCRADASGPTRIAALVPAFARVAATTRLAPDRAWRFVGLPVA